MSEPLMDHLGRALAAGNIGTILHVGAGTGAELPVYVAANPTHIRLLEPNPAAAKALQRAAADTPFVTVDVRALTGQNGTATLRIFNLAPLSSLRNPADLMRLFPGLHPVSEQEVVAVTVANLMAELPFVEGHSNILVLDAPGEEGRIIEDMRAGNWLKRFDHVFLYGGASQLYEGSLVVDELRNRLEAEGFRLKTTLRDDPDRPCLILKLDRSALKIVDLERSLTAVNTELKELEAKLATQTAAADTRLKETEAARAETDKRRNALLSERDKAAADLGLALRMQALLQSDLDELRIRYEQSESARAEQELLLRKLTPRLREAARDLQHDQQAALTGEVEPARSRPSKSRTAARKSGEENPPDVR